MADSCSLTLLDESMFPEKGGFIAGRWCAKLADSTNTSCCLPCPAGDWRYERVARIIDDRDAVGWTGIITLTVTVLMLLTFAVLPVQTTARHYFTTTALVGFSLMSLAFVVPFRSHPQQCYNAITPNNAMSRANCFVTSAILFTGIWILLLNSKSILTEIQRAQPASYQVGKICLLSSAHRSTATSWAPILAVAIISMLLQLLTVLYCVQVVTRPVISERLFERNRRSHASLGSNGSNGEGESDGDDRRLTIASDLRRALSMQRASSRIRKLLLIQWRPIGMVVLVAVYAAYVTSTSLRVGIAADYPADTTRQWLACMASAASSSAAGQEGEEICEGPASRIRGNQNEILAALFMIGSSGLWATILSFRSSMIGAWATVIEINRRLITARIKDTVARLSFRIRHLMQRAGSYSHADADEYAAEGEGEARV
ncbi:hypothetical protein BJY01DRAFT_245671 [Aspergillus pseudoustus]|uniref:G-protein coupled receptors family 3 profile domain-containing protein n=1 Tax=Aspergillus pseudoustus TaxID=1810923 RepID=A0ABR4KD45_9EURO